MKKYIIILSSLLIVVLGFVLSYIIFYNKNNGDDRECQERLTEQLENKSENKNEDIIDLIYKNGKIQEYFVQDNLDYFEILDIVDFGYFESKNNIRYFQVNYDFKCKDGTRSCNILDDLIDLKENFFSFKIAVDLNDKEYIEINPEITIYFNSDWIAT